MSLVIAPPNDHNYLPKATLKKGLHKAVISNIEDLGMVPLSAEILAKNRAQATREGKDPDKCKTEQPRARFFFSNAAGEYIAKDYTISLHDRSGLKKDLDAIGKVLKYGDTLASLVGTQVQLMVIEKTSGKGTKYVTIGTLTEPEEGQKVPVPSKVPNSKDASDAAKAAVQKPAAPSGGPITPSAPINDEDIPFS